MHDRHQSTTSSCSQYTNENMEDIYQSNTTSYCVMTSISFPPNGISPFPAGGKFPAVIIILQLSVEWRAQSMPKGYLDKHGSQGFFWVVSRDLHSSDWRWEGQGNSGGIHYDWIHREQSGNVKFLPSTPLCISVSAPPESITIHYWKSLPSGFGSYLLADTEYS